MLDLGRSRHLTGRSCRQQVCRSAPARPCLVQRSKVACASAATDSLKASEMQEQLRAKIEEALAGLSHSTRRVDAKVIRVQNVLGGSYTHHEFTEKPRFGRLDIDVLWEAQPNAKTPTPDGKEPSREPMQGLARVTLDTSGDSDRVRISNVQLLDEPDDEAPRMPSPQPAPPDVLLAVESLDSSIMEKLNDFMWELEESKDFPLETLDCEDQVRSK